MTCSHGQLHAEVLWPFLITSLLGLCLEWDAWYGQRLVRGIKQWVRQLQDECSCLVVRLLCVCDMLATLYLHNDRLRTSEWLLWLQTSQPHSKTGHREGGMFFRDAVILSDKETFSGRCLCLTHWSIPGPVPASRPNTENYITQLHRYR